MWDLIVFIPNNNYLNVTGMYTLGSRSGMWVMIGHKQQDSDEMIYR